jgi:hypothetical protein
MSQQQENKFTSKKKDEILKNLMLFNQKLLQDKKNVEGVFELSLHSGYKDRIVGSSYLAVPKEYIYQAFELLLKQGVGLFDADGSLSALGVEKDEIAMELFFNFMRIITEKTLKSEQFLNLERTEQDNPQVRDFVQNHIQALISYGIISSDEDSSSESEEK